MVFRIVPHLHKVKIKLSHVQQMTANQNIDGIHVKLQLRGAVTHEPEKKHGKTGIYHTGLTKLQRLRKQQSVC